MKFVDENIIESVLEDLEKGEFKTEELLQFFNEQQFPFVQFISSENFKLLSEGEFDLLLFNLLVLSQSIEKLTPIDLIKAEEIEKQDEKNWEVYNEEGQKNFSKVIDKFFLDYPQEDLLAFVEDSLATDEEDQISQVGKEIIFITCKTFIDASCTIN